eukprot:TRINITY_DN8468_c0_g1_i1.p1 TRINITY_DN8468_c0_g1~~TRINITY_DN8468_c0_g1_i1.p1  ORF type:complete len:389 (-),score=64.92 TRINITY_DN8468_c0_g1_i1:96-1262(-)
MYKQILMTLTIAILYHIGSCTPDFGTNPDLGTDLSIGQLQTITESPHLILFYTPWCSHSSSMLQLWDDFANDEEYPELTVARIDCESLFAYCESVNISQYPSIRLFYKNEVYIYDMPTYDLDAFQYFLKMKFDVQFYEEEVYKRKIVMQDRILEFDNYNVLYLTDDKLDDLYTKENILLLVYSDDCKASTEYNAVFLDLGPKAEGFVVAKTSCDESPDICRRFGIISYPTVLYIHTSGDIKEFEGNANVDSLTIFANAKIEDYEQDDAIIYVDENNYSEKTYAGNVYVLFYSKTCTHCKSVLETWKEYAKLVKDTALKVALIDCDVLNEICEKNEIKGYPTIRLVINGNTPFEFGISTPRTIENFNEFYEENVGKIDQNEENVGKMDL